MVSDCNVSKLHAKDLRIGNFVFAPALKSVRVIDCLDIRDFFEGRLYRPFEGVPLTEEWLAKFSFTKNPIAWHKDISYFPKAEFKTLCVTIGQGVLIRCGDLNKWREDDEVISLLNTDIQGPIMVHQLQNLFFALTGEELQCTPPH